MDEVDSKRQTFLPYHLSIIEQDEIDEVVDTLRSGWITTGPKTRQFESDFAAHVGSRHGIGVNSCTAGLHLALIALNIGPGDEVITTPITFPASANVVEHVGARPVFVDVEPDTLNIDPAAIRAAITDKTRAILPVHFAGHPCEMDEIGAIALEHGLAIIEDCAHAIESQYKGKQAGTFGSVAAFSFYATKNITTGEGGMIVTDDDALAERLHVLALHGISRDAWKRYSAEGYKHWETIEAGFKYNMFDIQAALGLHQLKKVDGWWERRKTLTERYTAALADLPGVEPLAIREHVKSAYHLYVVKIDPAVVGKTRDAIMNEMQERNIGVGVHFRALHTQQYYAEKYNPAPGQCPVAEDLSERILSLPLYPRMTDADLDDAIRTFKIVAGARA